MSPRRVPPKVVPLVGHFLFVVALLLCSWASAPMTLNWHQWSGLAACAILIGYACYHIGWMDGARWEVRNRLSSSTPNPAQHRSCGPADGPCESGGDTGTNVR